MSGSLKQATANPAVRRVLLALFGSTLGDWAYATAVTVWAYDVGGATAVGVFSAVRFVAVALSAPLGALLADKARSRKHVMVAADAIRAVLVAAAAVSIGVGAPAMVVFVLAIVSSMIGGAFRSARAGLVPSLVSGPEELTATNAVASNLETIAMFTGPALGGLLVGLIDVELVFWVNALSYVWSLSMIAAVRVPSTGEPQVEAEPADGPGDGFVAELTAGFRELVRERDLGAVTALAAVQGLIWGNLMVFLVMISLEVFDAGPEGVGYLNSLMGIGTVVGGLVVLTRVSRGTLGQDMAVGVLGWSLPLIAIAIAPTPVVAVVALAIVGLSDPWVNLGLGTIPQRLAPERMLSRVFTAVETAMVAATAIGSAVAPVLIDLVGLQPAMALVGALGVVVVAAYARRMRAMDRRLAEPEHLPLLRSIALFAPLPAPMQERLARRLETASYAAGATILAEGESSDRFYVIRSGEVVVTQGDRVLRTEGAGEFFGEIGLLRDVPRTASVTAALDTEVLTLDRADFLPAVTGVQESRRVAEEVVSFRLSV